MKNRSPAAVLVFSVLTLGIYSWYWAIKTKTEMNSKGNAIPTAWIWLIPIVGSVWWWWKYCEAVENVSQGKMTGVIAFLLAYLLGSIGFAIIQDTFNKIAPGTGIANNMPVSPQPAFGTQPSFNPQPPVDPQPPVNPQPPTIVQ
ncbi:MAG: DUF4234 domain-containing protein [Candidatus Saccharimonadales bacterium]